MPFKIAGADITFKKAMLPRLAGDSDIGGGFW
jgi:hypothetical protein